MDWKECSDKRIAKAIKPDIGLINSLIKSSNKRLESSNRLELDEVTAEAKLSLAYDSLREVLEALCIENGYKIYNHECYTAFLKEILMESRIGDNFDEMRKIRNAINYYGKDVTVKEAEEVINKIISIRLSVIKLLKTRPV